MTAFQTDFQIQTFLYVLYTGFFSCLAHCFISSLLGKKHFLFSLLLDLFLTVLTVYFLFLSIFHSGSASLRLYMVAAFFLGGALSHASVWTILKNLHIKRKSKERGE